MAEVFGVVVSALTVAELAGKLGASTIKLRKLWLEVQDAPDSISRLTQQLELLKPLLLEMEAVDDDKQAGYRGHAKLSIQYCQQAVQELERLAEDLQSQIATAKKSRRTVARFKVSLKKDTIHVYQERVQFALQMLSLSQQSYMISLVKPAQCSSEELPKKVPAIDAGEPELRNTDRSRRKTKPLPWHEASVFGAFSHRISPHIKHPDVQTFQARVQLPSWLSERAWDFHAYRACAGWKLSLRPWTTRPSSTPIFDYAARGSLPDVVDELNRNEASLADRNDLGWTLLHLAALQGNLETVKHLVSMGLSLEDTDIFGSTPLYYMCRAKADHTDVMTLYRFLAPFDELRDAIEVVFTPQTNESGRRKTSLHRLLWRTPGLMPMLLAEQEFEYCKLSPEARFGSLVWSYVDPEVMLDDLQRGGRVEPAAFRAVLHGWVQSSLHDFSMEYFHHSPSFESRRPGLDRNQSTQEEKFAFRRKLLRWVFKDADLKKEVSRQGNAPWEFTTPLFSGMMRREWENPKSSRDRRLKLKRLTGTMRLWLEDIQLAGIDLVEYGRYETSLYTANDRRRNWRWTELSLEPVGDDTSRMLPSGPRLVSFTFGARPEDWSLVWDFAFEDYVGQFWDEIENPHLHVPGEWVEDE